MKHPSRLRSTVACAAALGATLLVRARRRRTRPAVRRRPRPHRRRPPTAGDGIASYTGLTAAQKQQLMSIARDSWKFFADDVDPQTHLPLDNLTYADGSATPTEPGHLHLVGQHRCLPLVARLGVRSRADHS